MGSIYCYAFIAIYCIFCIVNSHEESIQCKDENGRAVDWYVLYKIPKIRESSDPIIRKGTKYLYMTDRTASDGWRASKVEISSTNSLPGRTLASLYKNSVASKSMWILYSDQAPDSDANSRHGHAKGVVMTDAKNGFWLIHSVPNYPPMTSNIISEYSYPSSGMQYGQSFLCISFDADQMNAIGVQLMYNRIISYQHNLPEVLSTQFPGLVNASRREKIKSPPYHRKDEIQSMNGQKFISFAKSDKWQQELYGDFIAPQLESNLYAETWMRSVDKLQSKCQRPRVLNVQSIVLDVVNVDFKSTHDHSKWAVATNNRSNKNWVCIGDINRASTQYSRGGGAVCINSLGLWNAYQSSVNEFESCLQMSGVFR